MKVFSTNISKTSMIALIVLFGFLTVNVTAQEKDAVKSKLDDIKGNVEKVTIKADGKDVVFEGKDAEKLVKKLKDRFEKKMIWVSEDGDTNKNVMTYSFDNDKDFDVKAGNMDKKVKVEIKDGNKKVTVTTMKDGKEETKVYEGAEAEKFLKDNARSESIKVIMKGDKDKEGNMFFVSKSGDKKCCCYCCGHEMDEKSGKKFKKIIIKETDTDKKSEKK